MEKIFIACTVAMLLGFALTLVCIKVAPLLGIMDVPKDERRMHDTPKPRMGGVAIFLAFCIALAVIGKFFSLLPYALGGLILVAVGLLDDKFGLKPWMKIVGQALAAVVLCAFGITVQFFEFVFVSFNTWYFAYPLTVIFVIAVTNFFNLIDGIDGLCTGITVFGCGGIAIVDMACGYGKAYPIALAFLFACIGFLPLNTNPAKIFLGDTGSMLCGFMMAALSMKVFYSVPDIGTDAMFALTPLVLIGIPLFDTCFAIIRRLMSGNSIFVGDKKHVHHRLTERYGQKGAVLILYLVAIVLAEIAFIMNSTIVGTVIGTALAVVLLGFSVFRFGICKD